MTANQLTCEVNARPRAAGSSSRHPFDAGAPWGDPWGRGIWERGLDALRRRASQILDLERA